MTYLKNIICPWARIGTFLRLEPVQATGTESEEKLMQECIKATIVHQQNQCHPD
jgi:hypothetical protein